MRIAIGLKATDLYPGKTGVPALVLTKADGSPITKGDNSYIVKGLGYASRTSS